MERRDLGEADQRWQVRTIESVAQPDNNPANSEPRPRLFNAAELRGIEGNASPSRGGIMARADSMRR